MRSWTAREGLFSDAINQVMEDDDGFFWLGTEHGIYRVARTELESARDHESGTMKILRLDESYGLASAETNGQKSQPAGWKARDGRLWFPTAKGVAAVDPRAFLELTPAPTAIIERVLANNRRVMDTGPSSWGMRPATGADARRAEAVTGIHAPLRLPPGGARVVRYFHGLGPRGGSGAELGRLTRRETEILELLARGHLYKEIAHTLGISAQTVNGHVKSIYEKLHVHSRGQAVAAWMRR